MGTLVVEPSDEITRADGSLARLLGRPDALDELATDRLPQGPSYGPSLSTDPTIRRMREVDWACEWWPPT